MVKWVLSGRVGWVQSLKVLAASVLSVVHGAELSANQRAGVAAIAASRPCLATALLYVAVTPLKSARGTLRFEGIPTSQSVMFLLDREGASQSTDMVPAWSPYMADSNAVPVYMAEIRWTLTDLAGRGPHRRQCEATLSATPRGLYSGRSIRL
jgi:hypothetical protein